MDLLSEEARLEELLTRDIFPDSRLVTPKGVKVASSKFSICHNWTPIFCASCGTPGGSVPSENMTFVCYLCDECADEWQDVTGVMLTSDEHYWAKVALEMLHQYGHMNLTEAELRELYQSAQGPFGKLLRESPLREQIDRGL